MTNREILALLNESGKEENFIKLYGQFKKLLTYYGVRLKYDDALCDMNLYFTELINELDKQKFSGDDPFGDSVQRYIAVCLKHKYIALSKQNIKKTESETYYCDGIAGQTNGFETSLELADALRRITERQRQAIVLKYVCGCSDVQISEKTGVSRQAVNRLINRGLASLRKNYL